MAGIDDEQIRLVLQCFAQDGNQAVAGIGDAATVDDFDVTLCFYRLQIEFQPGRKRSFDGVRSALHG